MDRIQIQIVTTSLKKRSGCMDHKPQLCSNTGSMHLNVTLSKIMEVDQPTPFQAFTYCCIIPIHDIDISRPLYDNTCETKFRE